MLKSFSFPNRISPFAFIGFTGIVAAFLAMDSMGSDTTSAKILLSPALVYLGPAVVGALLIRLRMKHDFTFPRPFQVAAWLGLTGLVFFEVAVSLYDFHSPVNTLFAQTRIQQEQLGSFIFWMGFSWVLFQPDQWWQRMIQRVVSVLPLLFLLSMWVMYLWPMNFMKEIVKEDHWIENLQAAVLVGGGIFVWYWLLQAWKRGVRHWHIGLLFFLTLGFMVIGGDEISWGQRYFGIVTPESIAEQNRQGELTLHNLHAVEWLVSIGYITIGLCGAFLGEILRRLRILPLLASICPPLRYMWFFLPPAIYNYVNVFTSRSFPPQFSEPVELLLYSGLIIWAVELTTRLLKKSQAYTNG